jgi:ABC-2 type transport system ATP-binding protein
MENILEIRGLSKEYKDFKLDNIDLVLPRGYIMGFIGPNGAGKTTTIKLIMNLIKRNSGVINIFGLDNLEYEKEIKERIGFVYDECYYYQKLSIEEMAKIISKFYKNWDWTDFNNYIEKFNLNRKKLIKDLSKGMKTKFSLAIALSHKAELIIMDEPTSGLDPVFRSEILDILYELIQDENKGILFSTHITSDLEKISDFITFLNNGKIQFSTSKDDLLESYYLIKGPKEVLTSDLRESLINLRENSFGFEALTKDFKKINCYKKDLVIEKPSIEDIMVNLVKGDK